MKLLCVNEDLLNRELGHDRGNFTPLFGLRDELTTDKELRGLRLHDRE